jgi:predicted HTH domain antitoxin
MKIAFDIDDKFSKKYSEHDIKMLFAVGLYEKGIMSTGDLARMVGMGRADFVLEMGKYGQSVFDMPEEELGRDVENARQFVL